MTRQHLDNTAARRVFLGAHGLRTPPKGPGRGADLLDAITGLGFVQIDSINTVARAHHMILAARRRSYRRSHLAPLAERDRSLFEHWTHDAAFIPTEFWPHWRHKAARDAETLQRQWRQNRRGAFETLLKDTERHIREHGPVTSAEIAPDEPRSSGGWWDWHPSKTALEYLWRSNVLCVTRRENFRKVYDLAERVIPEEGRHRRTSLEETIDWACNAALDRLGFATSGELAAFWAIATPGEARAWTDAARTDGRIVEITVDRADGTARPVFARPDIADRAAAPPGAMRVLSPFDPAIRDRKRTEALFGFHYRIEVFVPAPRRRYGYYVFPLLEGDRFVGRIDMAAMRADGRLHVRALWPERGCRWSPARQSRLETALKRTARLAGLDDITYDTGWLRAPK